MSIVTSLLHKFRFIEVPGSNATVSESRLTWIPLPTSRREWFSTSEQRGFDTMRQSRKARVDCQVRIPIVR